MGTEAQLDIPKPTIKRIVKEKLAGAVGNREGVKADVQLNKEALLAFGESAKVFISYITATANDVCKDKKRATLNADDVFTALEETDFAELLPQLKEAFQVYKQNLKEKKDKKAEITKKRKSAGQAGDGQDDEAAAAAAAGVADTTAAADTSAGGVGADADGDEAAAADDQEQEMEEAAAAAEDDDMADDEADEDEEEGRQ